MKNLKILTGYTLSILLSFLQNSAALSKDTTVDESLSYKDLFPNKQATDTPVTGNFFLRKMLEKHTSDLQACLEMLNNKAAMRGDGVATARSGFIVVTFRNDSQKGRDVNVKTSAFRYEDFESCLLRTVKKATLDDEAKTQIIDSQINFFIDCNLKKLPGTTWARTQVERKCSLRWETKE